MRRKRFKEDFNCTSGSYFRSSTTGVHSSFRSISWNQSVHDCYEYCIRV